MKNHSKTDRSIQAKGEDHWRDDREL